MPQLKRYVHDLQTIHGLKVIRNRNPNVVYLPGSLNREAVRREGNRHLAKVAATAAGSLIVGGLVTAEGVHAINHSTSVVYQDDLRHQNPSVVKETPLPSTVNLPQPTEVHLHFDK